MAEAVAVIMSAAFLWTFIAWMMDAHSKRRDIEGLRAINNYWVGRVRDAEKVNHDEIDNAYRRGVRDEHFKFTGEHIP